MSKPLRAGERVPIGLELGTGFPRKVNNLIMPDIARESMLERL
jgi:hypothetical protein